MNYEKQLQQEFTTIVQSNKKIIYKVCNIYSNNNEEINDLFQDVILNLWSGFPTFRNDCKIQTWIYRVALNTCINYLRKKKRIPNSIPIINIEEIPENSTYYKNIAEFKKIVNQLTDIEKAFLSLYLDNKTPCEISDIMGITKGNVAVKLHRLKEKMLNLSNK